MTVTDALSPVSPRPERTLTRTESARQTRSFTELAQTVRGLGLNNRTPRFYWALFAGLLVALAYGFALLTTFIPAYQASRIYPAEALRYE